MRRTGALDMQFDREGGGLRACGVALDSGRVPQGRAAHHRPDRRLTPNDCAAPLPGATARTAHGSAAPARSGNRLSRCPSAFQAWLDSRTWCAIGELTNIPHKMGPTGLISASAIVLAHTSPKDKEIHAS